MLLITKIAKLSTRQTQETGKPLKFVPANNSSPKVYANCFGYRIIALGCYRVLMGGWTRQVAALSGCIMGCCSLVGTHTLGCNKEVAALLR